jgi:WD40 repeat protein
MARKKSVYFKLKETREFMEIGGSPVPGITLRQVLRGHTGYINRIAWSPDRQYLASPSEDNTIRIWDVERGECVAILKGHENRVFCVAWSPNGRMLASGSGYPSGFAESTDNTVRIWRTRATC